MNNHTVTIPDGPRQSRAYMDEVERQGKILRGELEKLEKKGMPRAMIEEMLARFYDDVTHPQFGRLHPDDEIL